ncbi:helicase-related protein [Geomobilimonas luticola]|uniref:Helicase n=1 Tax=Geomobilimonas luticola TaxID=1114878 RepID=A0ABS5SDC6_9BACT|nr:helicase-related protein [Geomobilimonas luticola]MBT0652606.1 helicase [Geomobilimonas luticola]
METDLGCTGKEPIMSVKNAVRPNTISILAGLKDFQRRTVDYVFSRLYGNDDPSHRFLVADEVGLGKTMVARGVIAKAIEHLWDKVPRIDIVYICSNADIARQNINRLKPSGQSEFALSSRITLLPIEIKSLQENKLNFISFTPSTSFDLKSSLGTADERALLYWLLNRAWGIEGSTGPFNVLQGYADKDRFRALVNGYRERNHIDSSLAQKFADVLTRYVKNDKEAGRTDFRSRFDSLCSSFARARKYENIPDVEKRERLNFVGEMRSLLAETCLAALEPDLIILDEFQRFKHLLDAESETSRLAHGLFDYADENSCARVLLLSATPYKMYTLSEESGEDDHYEDFMRTMRFLEPGNSPLFEKLVGNYRRELYRLGNGSSEMLEESKLGLEAQLRRIMVRTERLAATEDRDGMLMEIPPVNVTLETQDLNSFLGMQKITKVLDQGNVLEYWKSAPYLLNFMDDYKLKQVFVDAICISNKNEELAEALTTADNLLLPWGEIVKYHEIDPNNSRLRALHADVIETGAWQLLWIPPALPYYRLEGPFADPALRKFTKRLVFSSWRMVPKVVATMLSYAVERRMISSFEEHPENSLDARKRRRPLLRFARTDERLTGMPLLGLLYPCTTLTKYCDPLQYETSLDLPSLVEVLEWAERVIEQLLVSIKSGGEGTGPEDETWYWAAPILLDLQFDAELSREWLRSPNLAGSWSDGTHDQQEGGEDESAWSSHVEYALKLANGELTLGRKPADLSRVLAQIALAGPGVSALRSLARVTGGVNNITSVIKGYAGQVAWRFRSLFNLPEVTAFIRGLNREEPYWRRVVEYSAAGGLQSVLDEYAHTLRESLGLVDHAPGEIARQVSMVMGESLSLRTSTLGVDDVVVNIDSNTVKVEGKRMRGHFALRFGEEKNDDGAVITRAGQVRDAFNSPFWPFVLATTSVGQEGLDFHTYCHAVVHWNLPSNPVDMEQREGRVHRYKGHAVRKNLASYYGVSKVRSAEKNDPWEAIFDHGKQDRAGDATDLVPFWIYPLVGGAKIERHVPTLPLSRDRDRLIALRKSLVVYRMVFGQARQEDLVEYLLSRFPESEASRITQQLSINLEPPL